MKVNLVNLQTNKAQNFYVLYSIQKLFELQTWIIKHIILNVIQILSLHLQTRSVGVGNHIGQIVWNSDQISCNLALCYNLNIASFIMYI